MRFKTALQKHKVFNRVFGNETSYIVRSMKIIQLFLIVIAVLGFTLAIFGAVIGSETIVRLFIKPAVIAVFALLFFIIFYIISTVYTKLSSKWLKKEQRQIDLFIFLSLFGLGLSILGFAGFFSGVFYRYGPTYPFIQQSVTWSLISSLSIIFMLIGFMRSRITKKTKPLGFIPTIIIIAFEAFWACMGVAALALIIVIIFGGIYLLWKE